MHEICWIRPFGNFMIVALLIIVASSVLNKLMNESDETFNRQGKRQFLLFMCELRLTQYKSRITPTQRWRKIECRNQHRTTSICSKCLSLHNWAWYRVDCVDCVADAHRNLSALDIYWNSCAFVVCILKHAFKHVDAVSLLIALGKKRIWQ